LSHDRSSPRPFPAAILLFPAGILIFSGGYSYVSGGNSIILVSKLNLSGGNSKFSGGYSKASGGYSGPFRRLFRTFRRKPGQYFKTGAGRISNQKWNDQDD